MSRVHVDSVLRVELPFVDLEADGDAIQADLDAGSPTVTMTKPDGSQVVLTPGDGLTVVDADAGETYWEDTVDQVGIWTWQGEWQGTKSKPVYRRVWANP